MNLTAHSGIGETAKKDESRGRKAITRDSCRLEAKSVVDSVKEKNTRAMMISGRPKQRAVIHAEFLQQQQRLLDAVAARKQVTSFLTPPPLSKKMAREGNSTMSGRKRKLEVNNKMATLMKGGSTTSSPKVTQTFFLSEQEKKLLQEIEAVSLLQEQLRQKR
ncbi:hypothetical protein PsorP6_005984 [Peronosclerospora sorghi]|uniref:Uncharacterized protein n=1 Tax=Peronosclerospora sorghi TaxID=230839 RepID=A0ACC0W2Z7_9STRA|nr:hypothetical protein PsorP6_005984 [Peronosclerospora sorghi]